MNHIKNKLRCRLTDRRFEPSAATVGPHLSALPTVQSVVKEYAAPSFTLGAIQVLRNADGGGGGKIFRKKRYEGVMFNVISVTRGWVGVQFPEK